MSLIRSIEKVKISNERLYNLSVREDETFIVNGVVVHNCKSYIQPIYSGKLGNREIAKIGPSDPSLEKYIQFHELNCCHGH